MRATLASNLETRRIRKLVALLDQQVPKGEEKIRVYYLENADAEEVAKVLDAPVDAEQPMLTLPGGEQSDLGGLMRQIAARYQVDAQTSRRLMRLYGSEVFAVLGETPTPITSA